MLRHDAAGVPWLPHCQSGSACAAAAHLLQCHRPPGQMLHFQQVTDIDPTQDMCTKFKMLMAPARPVLI